MKPHFPLIAALAAVLLAGAGAANSSPARTGSTSTPPSAGAPNGPANLANPVRKTKASIDLVCDDGKTYSVSTGTSTGSCGTSGKDSAAVCTEGTKVTAQASCSGGCLQTHGAGSCSAK